jgi:hypothetical protein
MAVHDHMGDETAAGTNLYVGAYDTKRADLAPGAEFSV